MSVNFTNHNNQYVQNPELQKRLEAGDVDFGAIDREKLKQDTAEFADKTKQSVDQNVQDNGYVQLNKKMKGSNTKKTIKSILLALVATVGLAVVGNKTSNFMVKLGLNLDDVLSKNKLYTSVGDFFKNTTQKTGDFLKKSKTIQDISETLKNRPAKQKNMWARGYGRGIRNIFALTPPDIIKKGFSDIDAKKQSDIFEALTGSRAKEIQALLQNGNDNVEFCNKLTDAIAEHFGHKDAAGKIDYRGLMSTFEKMQKGEIAPELADVVMKEKGAGLGRLMSDWWPVNFINSAMGKITGGKWKPICHGNLGDSLIKFNAVNGTLAKTGPAKVIQQAILDITEMPSNFVNDKSGFGVFLCATTLPALFNSVQDAPKEKKFSTIADDFVGSVGTMVLASPIAAGAVYGTASLKNLKADTFVGKVLKQIGKFFGMGLDKTLADGKKIINSNKLTGFAGGAMRLILIMFVLTPMISKPIRKAINKVFGKPYDPSEAQREQQAEEQKNTVIPELGITQGELIDKINKNPEAIQKLQQDPKLAELIQKDPKLLVDYLDGKDITTLSQQAQSPEKKTMTLAPANQGLVKDNLPKSNMVQNDAPQSALNQAQNSVATNKQEENITEDDNMPKDTATYIPSSKFKAKNSSLSDAESREIQDALTKADKVLAKAEKYL